jgi:hypothetical protein
MTLVAYNFLPEMEVNKIMMEEDGVFEQRVVERANQHSAINHWGLVFPRPLRNRDCVTQCVFQEIEDDACIIAVESTEHGAAPPQDGVVRFYIRRLFRFSPISPTTTRVIVTSTFQLGGAIPRFVSDVRCLKLVRPELPRPLTLSLRRASPPQQLLARPSPHCATSSR